MILNKDRKEKVMDKEYIQKLYRQAITDFKYAHNEEERWAARHDMAKLERFAIETFGYEFIESTLEPMKTQLTAGIH